MAEICGECRNLIMDFFTRCIDCGMVLCDFCSLEKDRCDSCELDK